MTNIHFSNMSLGQHNSQVNVVQQPHISVIFVVEVIIVQIYVVRTRTL